MRICRFDENRVGLVIGEGIHDVTDALRSLPAWTYPLPVFDPFIANLAKLRPVLEEKSQHSVGKVLDGVRLLSPVANPGKIIAAPVNYKKHLEEVLAQKELHHGNLINEIHRARLFLKATSSLIGPSQTIELVHLDRRNDHEVELAVVIGKPARKVSAAKALDYVAGYCIGLDITIRGPEERSFRKSPDSYTVLGPWLVTTDELRDPSRLSFSISVNGEVRQDANTDDLVLGVNELIELASSFYTLHPGDVILTGTPQGVGAVRPGDVLVARMDGIGEMHVQVRAAKN
ncbi:MAG: fumarylacetoacetate hydrolase family protein [Xanthobacteraceae bacterium]|nr:fumarylacetoacetate hydrolase family protein [Xanthobacteraceae bacterium]